MVETLEDGDGGIETEQAADHVTLSWQEADDTDTSDEEVHAFFLVSVLLYGLAYHLIYTMPVLIHLLTYNYVALG